MASCSGSDDCEVEVGGEENDSSLWKLCTKNPQHKSFWPVHDFELNLDPKWRQPGIIEFIKLQCFLTVSLKVRVRKVRRGTGYICGIKEFNDGSCPCSDCEKQLPRSKAWWVNIRTCKHVIQGESTGEKTTASESVVSTRENATACESAVKKTTAFLFYDCKDKIGTECLKGVRSFRQDHESDYFEFQCITHKRELANKIREKLELFPLLRGQINQEGGPETIVIVSHPHGSFKRVTVGSLKEWGLRKDSFRAEYDACTCPGSSGAAVWRIGRVGTHAPWPYDGVHHCRRSLSNSERNEAKWWPV